MKHFVLITAISLVAACDHAIDVGAESAVDENAATCPFQSLLTLGGEQSFSTVECKTHYDGKPMTITLLGSNLDFFEPTLDRAYVHITTPNGMTLTTTPAVGFIPRAGDEYSFAFTLGGATYDVSTGTTTHPQLGFYFWVTAGGTTKQLLCE